MPAPRGSDCWEVEPSSLESHRSQGYGYGYGEAKSASSRNHKTTTKSTGRPAARLSPAVPEIQDDEETRSSPERKELRPQNGAGRRSNGFRPTAVATEEEPDEPELVAEPEPVAEPDAEEAPALLRDAELLEAWSRGETLIIEDEVQLEQGNCDVEASLGSKARKLRKRVRRRVRRIQENLLDEFDAEIDAEIDAENIMEDAIANGQLWNDGYGLVTEDFDLEDLDLEDLQGPLEDGYGEVEDLEEEEFEDLEDEIDPQELFEMAVPSTDEELEDFDEAQDAQERPASLVPAAMIAAQEPGRKRAQLVPEKSKTAALVARLRSRPQLVPAVGKAGVKRKDQAPDDVMQARYMPPHEKRRRIELAKWKEIKAAWHRKLLEEEARGPQRKQKAGPNMRALARRFEATLENPGSCCFNQLQKDESITISADGLRAQCDPSSNPNVMPSGGIKGLPLVAGGRYQYEVELHRACSLTIGWSPALVLPSSVASSGRSAARRMLGYSSDGELVGEGLMEVPAFGRQGDVVGALLDWPEGSCGPRLSFMLNGRNLGVAFDLRAEGLDTPPLQLHICQGPGRPFSILLRGASQQVPLRFPMHGYRPLGNTAEKHFSPFSKAVELATSTAENGGPRRQQKPPPAAARRLIHSSLGLALPLPHVAQEKSLGKTLRPSRTVTRQDDEET